MGRARGILPASARVSRAVSAPVQGLPRVGAVVLTWNDTEMAGSCIESVLGSDYANLQVILVDNGSIEPCGKILGDRFPGLDVVVLPRNQGFTGGSNRGMERALELGCDYVFLLNNDTIVGSNAISVVVAEMEAREEVGLATPLLLLDQEKPVVGFYTGEIDRNVARHVHHESGTPVGARDWPTVETDFIPLCAAMFRASALRDVGLLDETLGTNWEDYDLCLRFNDAGWKLITVGTGQVRHLHGATTGKNSPYITYYMTRNRLICLFRYGSKAGILRRTPFILRTFYWQVRGYGLGNLACHAAFLKGVLHFMLGVRGEGSPPRNRKG